MVRLTRTANFSDTVILSFHVDGTHIYVPVPKECLQDTQTCDSNIGSLSDIDNFDVNFPDWMPEKRVLQTSFPYWEVSSKLKLNPGSVMIQILDVKDLKSAKTDTLFSRHQYTKVLFEITEKLRNILIEAKCNTEFYVFPKSVEEINIVESDDLKWAQTKAGYAEAAPADITFVTPLSNDLLLVIDTNTKIFDYGTEEENAAMRAEAEADLFDFIRSIRIEFSPEIQAQIDAARATENA